MHLFAKLLLEDLESARNQFVASFEKLTLDQWKRKIPGGEHNVYDLANHALSDTQRLAILASVVGMHDLFPNPTKEHRYSCVWKNERVTLSPQNIIAKSKYERNKLRTHLTFIRDHKLARKLYESNFQTGWHERMHVFDLQQAFADKHQYIAIAQDAETTIERLIEQLNVIFLLYDIDDSKIDEIAQTNQTYRQEIKQLTQGRFVDAIHRWLGISDHMPRLKGNVDIAQQTHHIHSLCNDMIAHTRSLNTEQLATMIDGKPFMKRLQRIVLDFQTKIFLFKKISLRDSWAQKASL